MGSWRPCAAEPGACPAGTQQPATDLAESPARIEHLRTAYAGDAGSAAAPRRLSSGAQCSQPRTARSPPAQRDASPVALSSRPALQFHCFLGLQALAISKDRGDCQPLAGPTKGDGAIVVLEAAVDLDSVPTFGVSHVVDRDVVMLTPEKWHGVEAFSAAEHVARSGLALAFGDHPMLHANQLTRMRIGPAGDIACGEDTWRARLQVLVNQDAAIEREPRLLRQHQTRPHADTDHDHIGIDRCPIAERDASTIESVDRAAETKRDAMGLV